MLYPVFFPLGGYYPKCDGINDFVTNHWIPLISLGLGFLSAAIIYQEIKKSQELLNIMTGKESLNVLIIGILSSIAILFIAKVFEFGVRLGINLYENTDKTIENKNSKLENNEKITKKPIKDIILETANRTFNPFYHCTESNK